MLSRTRRQTSLVTGTRYQNAIPHYTFMPRGDPTTLNKGQECCNDIHMDGVLPTCRLPADMYGTAISFLYGTSSQASPASERLMLEAAFLQPLKQVDMVQGQQDTPSKFSVVLGVWG